MAVCVIVLLITGAAQVDPASAGVILLFDDFNSEAGPASAYSSFDNWDVTAGTVDIITGLGALNPDPNGHGIFVDLDGTDFIEPLRAGRMETKTEFVLVAGTYTLQFDLAGSHREFAIGGIPDTNNVLTVALGGVYSEEFTRTTLAPFETITRTIVVTAATSGRLRIG